MKSSNRFLPTVVQTQKTLPVQLLPFFSLRREVVREDLDPMFIMTKGTVQVYKIITFKLFDQPNIAGDMAGLAFGMIFGGMLLAGVIYFFALRNNVRAGIPVMRGFDNPLTGLTNLVK